MEALSAYSLPPGFGFHPTDVELISHYLKRKILGLKIDNEIIHEIDIYKQEPWDLPARCRIPTRNSKWHFFAPRDKKYPTGSRLNRATEAGYWKSTGKDRSIKYQNHVIGTKKTLVFHEGRPPSGKRTEWIMHEYYINENEFKGTPVLKDAYVLCRVANRNGWGIDGENISENVTPQSENIDESTSKQHEDAASSVAQEILSSPSESADDIDAWVEELYDPNFSGSPIRSEVQSEQTEGLSPLAVTQEPINSQFHHDVSEESHLLFPVDEFYNILYSEPQSLDLFGELNIQNFNSFCDQQEDVGLTAYLNNTNDEFTTNNDSTTWTGIQRREREAKPSSATTVSSRIKLQVSKMESRSGGTLSQIFEVSQGVHLDHLESLRSDNKSVSTKALKGRKRSGFSQLAIMSCFFGMMGIVAFICFFFPLRGARGFVGSSNALEL